MTLPMPFLAILSAAAAYWLLGILWYGVLFARPRRRGVPYEGRERPGVVTLVASLVAAFVSTTAVAWVLQCFSVTGSPVALRLATVLGAGLAAGALGNTYSWRRHALGSFLIDACYHVLGVLLAALVLMQWRR